MKECRQKLYSGDFNTMEQSWQPDGSVIITLRKDNDPRTWKLKVKNLYQENEEVLEHEIIEAKPPKYVLDRMEEAKKGKEVISA